MRLIKFLFVSVVSTIICCLLINPNVYAKSDSAAPKAPNIIVIFTDDQGYEDVGVFGGDHVLTPNLDQMAEEGMRLTDFYVPAPLCSPSRAAMMTGSYPRRINMASGSRFPVLLNQDPKGLNPSEVTLAEVLKTAGYKTGMFGKWHLGDQPAFLPTRQGFDEFFGLPYSHDIAPTHRRQAHFKFPDLPLMDGDTVIEMNPNPANLTRRITNKAIDFISRHQDEPFFVYLPQPMPHGPLHVSDEFIAGVGQASVKQFGLTAEEIKKRNRRALYPLVIAELDHSIGRILQTLKALNIDDNTLVIFTSDNGPSGRTNSDGSQRLLAGHKTQTLEGGMRVPAIIRWPGKIPAASQSSEVMSVMDILPTAAYLAGVGLMKDRKIDGYNIWPILSGQNNVKSPYEAFYYFRENQIEAVRMGRWKLNVLGQRPGLYDLNLDPAENKDLAKKFPNRVVRLKDSIAQFKQNMQIKENGSCGKCRPAGYVDAPVNLMLQKNNRRTD